MNDASDGPANGTPNGEPARHPGTFADWSRRLRERPTAEPAAGAGVDVEALDASALEGSVRFAAEHVRRYIASSGMDDGWDGPKPILILYTKGRKSGVYRRHPLLMYEHGGERYVVGSKGGSDRPPDWLLNLEADPDVHVRVMEALYPARAVIVPDATRAALWPDLTARYPMFASYQASTARQIPLVHLLRVSRHD